MDGEENSLVLTNLTPDTEYAVSVFSIIGEESSEPLKGTETTCKLHKCLPPLCVLFYSSSNFSNSSYFILHPVNSEITPPLQTTVNTIMQTFWLGMTIVKVDSY